MLAKECYWNKSYEGINSLGMQNTLDFNVNFDDKYQNSKLNISLEFLCVCFFRYD